jgi:3,4-dihydroxy 2-butanone 4-phosphate synthase/GTP cyclohydrolase II
LPGYTIPSQYGEWTVVPFKQLTTDDIHLALIKGNPASQASSLVRVHSMSRTGDLLGLIFGQTGKEIDHALSKIAEDGNGVFLLMRHSEQSDNVLDVLSAFAAQHEPAATTSQQRDIGVGAQILRELGITRMKLMSNHDVHRVGLIGFGLEIVENVKL